MFTSSSSDDEYRDLEVYLISGLRFHFSATLRQVPLEIALHVMAEAWRMANGLD